MINVALTAKWVLGNDGFYGKVNGTSIQLWQTIKVSWTTSWVPARGDFYGIMRSRVTYHCILVWQLIQVNWIANWVPDRGDFYSIMKSRVTYHCILAWQLTQVNWLPIDFLIEVTSTAPWNPEALTIVEGFDNSSKSIELLVGCLWEVTSTMSPRFQSPTIASKWRICMGQNFWSDARSALKRFVSSESGQSSALTQVGRKTCWKFPFERLDRVRLTRVVGNRACSCRNQDASYMVCGSCNLHKWIRPSQARVGDRVNEQQKEITVYAASCEISKVRVEESEDILRSDSVRPE